MVTLEKARKILLANACCSLGNKCSMCPFYERSECLDVSERDILEEAIEVVYTEVKKYAEN